MKKYKMTAFILALTFILTMVSETSCAQNITGETAFNENTTGILKLAGSPNNTKNNQGPLKITPSDYISGSNLKAQPKKAYTILIYMNGSDLESEYKAATNDLNEMINSKFDSQNINLIIFTGGAKKWHTEGIPNRENAIFKMENGQLKKLAQIGRDPMGYPETLAGFINFGYNLFPADKYGLVFWNHGGGAIAGYGSDERFDDPNKVMMKLSEIDSALGNNNLYKNGKKFDFIGFDTCLMATLEMACITAKYGNYLVASEELEPEDGWDYSFLRNIKPKTTGSEAGILIAEYYKNYYRNRKIQDIITISVTDLSKIEEVANYFEILAIEGRNEILNGQYRYISRARSYHRSFGSRGEFTEETDMIDAANLADSLFNLLPYESIDLIEAIYDAVIYKYEDNIEELGGLSVYFPFANKSNLNYFMWVYSSINHLPEYFNFLDEFCYILDSKPLIDYGGITNFVLKREDINIINAYENSRGRSPLRPADGNAVRISRDAEGVVPYKLDEEYKIKLTPEQLDNLAKIHQTTWKKSDIPGKYIQVSETNQVNVEEDGTVDMNFTGDCITLNGNLVCLYETAPLSDGTRYSIPVKLNGEDADLIAVYNEKHPDGEIIGAVPSGDDIYNILDKKVVKLRDGDKIQILYYSESFGKSGEDTEEMNDGKETEIWQKGEEFTVSLKDGLTLKKEPLKNGEYIYGLNFIDLQHNKYYSNFLSVGIK